MIVVILAGGSGTRLWPLSTSKKPKHLLNLVDDESLLQNTFKRAKQIADDVYVITEKGHADKVSEQLPELPKESLIIEPDRRGTISCILAGLCVVSKKHGNEEQVAFIHADHVVHNVRGFKSSFGNAAKAAAKYDRITLVGVRPSYAATGFGYIQINGQVDANSIAHVVMDFKEKPNKKLAEKYVKSGEYLWNCGYFVGSVNTFKDALQKYSSEWGKCLDQLMATKNETEFKKVYLSFKNETIDYALMERDKELLVVPATFDWVDLGTFSDIYETVDKDDDANYIRGEGIITDSVKNSYIYNEESGKSIGIIGLKDVVIVNTKHGMIIARRDMSQNVKDIAKRLQQE